ncbi:uncharacterized protein [Zea mays]|uniref:uncharacterized protein n=1 Tax=Zea mays TaxID=4577 RepID=UPI000220891E|nr:uncharacterized protein LOC103647394 [Zea mays]|eukprot:XP_008670159.1 uncharacterized protein LOC103647394 [Zea mays]
MPRSQLLCRRRRRWRVAPLLESEMERWTGVDEPELATFSRRMSSWTIGERPTQRSTNSSMVSCRPVPTSRSSDPSLTTNSLPSSRFRIRHLGSASSSSSPSGVASEEPDDRPPSGGLVAEDGTAPPSDLDREMGSEAGAGRTSTSPSS